MGVSGKKEYALVINGITQNITAVTKLEDAVKSLDGTIGRANNSTINATRVSKEKSRVLSDEEKAEKKLSDTLAKVARAKSEENQRQLAANQALREATREAARRIQVSQLEEGSVKRLGMELTDLRNKYYALSEADRENLEVGGQTLQQIQAMDAQYKTAKESAGQFQDSVGNYGKATEGLGQLAEGLNGVAKTARGMAQGLMGSVMLLGMFGEQSEEGAKRTRDLQKIIVLLGIAQQFSNKVLRDGVAAKIQDAAAEKARAVATTVSTAATTAGSVALKLFKKALVATGIGAIVVLLGTLIANFGGIRDAIVKVFPALGNLGDAFDKFKATAVGVGNAVINYVLMPFRAIGASVKKILDGDIKGAFTEGFAEIKKGFGVVGNYQKGFNDQTERNQKNADARRRKEAAKSRAAELDDIIKDNEAKAGSDWKYSKEGQKAYAELYATKKILYADDAKALKELQREGWGYFADLTKHTESAASSAATASKQRAEAELQAYRNAGDAKLRLIENADEKARQQLALGYDRQIEDLKNRLATENALTANARKYINDAILSLENEKGVELSKLRDEQAKAADEQAKTRIAKERELFRAAEDATIAAIPDGFERRRTEVNTQYDRQIEDLKRRSAEETDLTEEAQAHISKLVIEAETARGRALMALNLAESEKRNSQELAQIDDFLAEARTHIGDVVARGRTGLELIDIDATRKNLAETNAVLDVYVLGLKKYQEDVTSAHLKTLETLKEGTPEYEDEMSEYSAIMRKTAGDITKAEDEQAQNTKASTRLQVEYYKDLFEKIGKLAEGGLQALDAVTSTFSMGLQTQLDDLNAQLDGINDRYQEVQKQREDSVKRVEQLEADLQAATGGTAEALKQQLQDEMHARAEAEREEARLATEKERHEAEIAKKEKQMKRLDLISNIAQGIANTAQGATRALLWGPILGPIYAAIVSGFGLAQVGIMTRQLAKLEYGGEIQGPSHSNGGVDIVVNGKPSYEAQGGEFMVNDVSYGANKSLVNFINDARGPVSLSELAGVLPGETTPVIVNEVSRSSEDKIVEAINEKEYNPVVSVVDIIETTDDVVSVRDLAGA